MRVRSPEVSRMHQEDNQLVKDNQLADNLVVDNRMVDSQAEDSQVVDNLEDSLDIQVVRFLGADIQEERVQADSRVAVERSQEQDSLDSHTVWGLAVESQTSLEAAKVAKKAKDFS